MEVGVRAETENLLNGDIRHVASAYLTFVALDGHPTTVPELTLETDDQKRRNRMARARRKARLAGKQRESACGEDPERCES